MVDIIDIFNIILFIIRIEKQFGNQSIVISNLEVK